MRHVEELGIPELTGEQVEELCLIAEEGARKYIQSKIPSKMIETFNISAEAEGAKPVALKVDVDISLSPLEKDIDVQSLVDEAVKKAFTSAEKYLRELKCLLHK